MDRKSTLAIPEPIVQLQRQLERGIPPEEASELSGFGDKKNHCRQTIIKTLGYLNVRVATCCMCASG